MSILQVTYPTSPTLDWTSSTSITVSGLSEAQAYSVFVNSSSGGVTFNLDKSWSYPFTILSYVGNNLVIESKDIDGNLVSTVNFDIVVKEPILDQLDFNILSPVLLGKTSALASQVEVSFDSLTFNNVTSFIPHTNVFGQDFTFPLAIQDIYLRGLDALSQYSNVGLYTLSYKLNAPEISSFTNPATSRHVSVSGTSDYETKSFIFSPDEVSSSGVFASGSVTGTSNYTEWEYSFTLMSPSQNFTIKTVDVFGNESVESNQNITYELSQPEILEPALSTSSKFNETIKGTCDLNSVGVLYSTESSFNKAKIVSSSGYFTISGSVNDEFQIIVDSEIHHITLTPGTRSASDIVTEINSYFSNIVASETVGRIVLSGNLIEVLNGSANSTLGFIEGIYRVSYEFSLPSSPISFLNRNALELNIDGVDYRIEFSKETSYTEEDIILALNMAVEKTIAFLGSVIITASKNIHIKKSFPDLGITNPVYLGLLQNILGNWSLNFDFYKPSVVWNFCSLDEFYRTSSIISKTLDYLIYAPFITKPGTPKILSDNTYMSSSGSSSIFETASGNFIVDGVLATDKVLVLSGKNVGKINDVIAVSEKFLETSSFSDMFTNGDSISIYASSERPSIVTNLLPQNYEGLCDPASNLILYSSSENLVDGYAKLYFPQKTFAFAADNKTLHLAIDGEEEYITFKEDFLEPQNLIDEINGYFSSAVAFLEGTSDIYLQGNNIAIFDCSSLSELGVPSGNYSQGLEVLVPDTYQFNSGDANYISLNIDNKNVQFLHINQNADLATIFTRQYLVDKINELYADKTVAFQASGKMVLLGNINISVLAAIPLISLSLYEVGYTNFSSGSYVWNKNLTLNQSATKFNVYGLNYFYKITTPNTLAISFKIDMPTLTTPGQKRNPDTGELYLETTFDYLNIQGNFNPVGGYVVDVNGVDVYSDHDSWVYKLESLISGTNLITVYTRDIFGLSSDALTFNVIFNDPQSVTYPESTETGTLTWSRLANVSLGDKTVTAMLQAIDDVFKPILQGLNTLTTLLKRLRAWISKFLGIDFLLMLKKALEKYINDIISYMDNLVNGTGLYVLSTLPTKNLFTKDTFAYLEGGFDGFISKVNASFEDQLDPSRPIMTSTTSVGGMVFVASDSGGVNDMLESIKTLGQIFTKENSDFGLVPPENLKAIGENQRVSLSWNMPLTAISPTGFYIYRSRNPGGTPRKIRLSGADFGPNKAGDVDRFVYDQQTGAITTDYDCIGVLGAVSPIDVPNWNALTTSVDGDLLPALLPMVGTAWWEQYAKILRSQVVKDFMFIDGVATLNEASLAKANEQTATELNLAKLEQAAGVMNLVGDFAKIASNCNNLALQNGKTFFYKVVPAYIGSTSTGNSYEVVATPTAPNLIYMDEDLSSQIKNLDANGDSLNYNLSSAIYDKNLGVFGSTSANIDVFVDGAKIEPKTIYYNKGKFLLEKRNQPKNKITAKYWGKVVRESTRAVIVGSKQGDFTILRGTDGKHESNFLSIQVGRGLNFPKIINDSLPAAYGEQAAWQNVTLVRDFGKQPDGKTPNDSVIKSAEEVAQIIRSQTTGINVRTDNLSRIVIEDSMNPNVYNGSYLKIHGINTVLGFNNNESDAGPSSGTPPNWYSLKPSDLFPVLNEVLRYIQDTANKLLGAFENATKSLTDFIDLLIAKVAALAAMAQEIKDLLDKLAKQMKLSAGIFYLNIPYKTGGIDYFRNSLTTAIGRPTTSDYAGGIVLMYSAGATASAMNLIFGPLNNIKL